MYICDKANGISAEMHLSVQEEMNLILLKITTSCPILTSALLGLPCVVSQLWLGGASSSLGGSPRTDSPHTFGLEGPSRGIQTYECLLHGDLGS